MLKRLSVFLRRLICLRHDWRPSTSWPGVIVCRRCGHRRAGETSQKSLEA